MEVYVKRNGKVHFARFENGGHVVQPLKVIDNCDEKETGTTVRFYADSTIFETLEYEYEVLENRFWERLFYARDW